MTTKLSARLAGLRAGFWGLSDQALVSASNFVTMVILARSLHANDFGAFVLVFMALQFAGSLQQSLVARPHNVLAAPMTGQAFAAYTAYAAQVQFALALLFTALSLAGAGIAYFMDWGVFPLLLALAAAVFAWQMQEFVRQVRYTEGNPREVFACDVISYAGQAALIAVFWQMELLTGPIALYTIGFTSALSAVYGLLRLDLPSRGLSWPILKRNWQFGKWLVVDSLGQWLSTQMYPLIGAAVIGISSAGILRAVQNLVAPAHVLLNAFQSIAVPRAARAYKTGGQRELMRFLLPATLLTALPLALYFAALGVLGPRLLAFLYTEEYQGYEPLIWLFCLTYLALYAVQALSVALMAMDNTRGIVVGRVVAVVLTLTLGVALTWAFGIYGMVVASFLTLLAMGFVLVHQIASTGSTGDRRRERERLSSMFAAGRSS